jgi:hypothetical protein
METYLHDLIPPAHRTKEQAEQGKARAAVRDSVRAGQTPAERQAAGIGKDLSPASLKQTIRTAKRSGLDLAFQRASLKQAIHAYELATPEERLEVRDLLVRKLASVDREGAAAGAAGGDGEVPGGDAAAGGEEGVVGDLMMMMMNGSVPRCC